MKPYEFYKIEKTIETIDDELNVIHLPQKIPLTRPYTGVALICEEFEPVDSYEKRVLSIVLTCEEIEEYEQKKDS